MSAAILEAAEVYIARGWPVFPVDATSKRPLIATGRDHAEHASRDLAQVERWIRGFHGCGLAIPTGAASGTVVIDADAKHDGEHLLAELEAALGALPRARVVRTRSGGLHVYLQHPRPGLRVRTGAGARSPLGRLLGDRPGVDVRADGGIVVLPPSCGYSWIGDEEPPSVSARWLAAIQGAGEPPAVVHRAPMVRDVAEDQRVRRARAYLAKLPAAIAGSGGHGVTFDVAAHLVVGFDLGEGAALALLRDEYNPRCDPPWSERELAHKVRSAAARSTRTRGYLLTEDRHAR